MKRAMEMVALLEAQIKDMNPNLDSIAEYGVIYSFLLLFFFFFGLNTQVTPLLSQI